MAAPFLPRAFVDLVNSPLEKREGEVEKGEPNQQASWCYSHHWCH